MKYRITKDHNERGWKTGEVVFVTGRLTGDVEAVPDDTPHQHVLVLAKALSILSK